MAMTSDRERLSELERQAETSRAELAQTVDELHSRVSPSAIKDDMKDYMRERSQDMVDRVSSYARDNPLQAAAIAAGVAWPAWRMLSRMPAPLLLIGAGIALSRRSSGSSGAYRTDWRNGSAGYDGQMGADGSGHGVMDDVKDRVDDVKDRMSDMKDQVTDAGHQAMDKVSDTLASGRDMAANAVSSAKEKVTDAYRSGADKANQMANQTMRQASEMYNQTSDTLVNSIDRHPLLAGGVVFAVGALLASALPSTRQENRLLGMASDELKRRTGDAALDTMAEARSAARDVYRSVRDDVREQGLTPDVAKKTVQKAAEKARDVFDEAAGQANLNANPSNQENGNG